MLRKSASFDRVVWFYDPLARLIFDNAIRQSQVFLLPFIPAQASILIVGGGTGWILTDLAQLHIPLKILYLELSDQMLTRARQQLIQLPDNSLEVTFRQGTEANLRLNEIFEVIFTPFVLDLYPESALQLSMQRLQDHLQPAGLWLVADFFIDRNQNSWQQWWQNRLSQAMYAFFGWLCGLETRTLPDFDQLFKNLPLQLVHTQFFYQRFIRSQVYCKNFKVQKSA